MTAGTISATVAAMPGSGIRAIATLAWADPGAVHLEFGEPDFATPDHVVAAAAAAAAAGATRYAPTAGLPELRAAICTKLRRDNGIDADIGQVMVTAGGVGALAAAYRAILDPGSEILVPDPGWPNLTSIAVLAGGVPVPYPLGAGGDHRPDVGALDRLITPATRAIAVNNPSNPLGSCWPAEVLAEIGSWAAARGLTVISDECYDQLWLDEPPPTFSVIAPESSTITVFSLSKSYAMTGWRVGYAYASEPVIAAMTRVQETTTSCVNTPAQHAAVAALTGPQDAVGRMRDVYRTRRDDAITTAAELGLRVDRPRGAFYLWVDLPGSAGPATAFALTLLREYGVAVAPGTAFGTGGEGHLRVSLAANSSDIRRGLYAIHDLLDVGAR